MKTTREIYFFNDRCVLYPWSGIFATTFLYFDRRQLLAHHNPTIYYYSNATLSGAREGKQHQRRAFNSFMPSITMGLMGLYLGVIKIVPAITA